MKDLLYAELITLVTENEWFDANVKEQARAIFTTICVVWNIEVDTGEYDSMLINLYEKANLKNVIDYTDYDNYMAELIVYMELDYIV